MVKKKGKTQTFLKVAVSRQLETIKALGKICFKTKETTKSKFAIKVIGPKKRGKNGLDRARPSDCFI